MGVQLAVPPDETRVGRGQLPSAMHDTAFGPAVLVCAAVMGLTFLSTVPPTAGLVVKFFGRSNKATLFGPLMFTHQVGAFLGAWLGGRVFGATGSCDWVWYVDIVLAVGSALIRLPIRDAPVVRAASA